MSVNRDPREFPQAALTLQIETAANHVERARRFLRLRTARLERLIDLAYGDAGDLTTVRKTVTEHGLTANATAEKERGR